MKSERTTEYSTFEPSYVQTQEVVEWTLDGGGTFEGGRLNERVSIISYTYEQFSNRG